MVLIDHLKRQLRNHGTSICRKVCLEVLKEAWTPRERLQSSSIATNRTSVLQSSAASKDVFFLWMFDDFCICIELLCELTMDLE